MCRTSNSSLNETPLRMSGVYDLRRGLRHSCMSLAPACDALVKMYCPISRADLGACMVVPPAEQASREPCWGTRLQLWGCGQPSLTSHPMTTGHWQSAAGSRSRTRGMLTQNPALYLCAWAVLTDGAWVLICCPLLHTCMSVWPVWYIVIYTYTRVGKYRFRCLACPRAAMCFHTTPHAFCNSCAASCPPHVSRPFQATLCRDPHHPDSFAAEAGRPHPAFGPIRAAAQPGRATGACTDPGGHGPWHQVKPHGCQHTRAAEEGELGVL
jgi:hypothetical protein